MVYKQWLLATGFVPRKRRVVSLDTYRAFTKKSLARSRVDRDWPAVLESLLSEVEFPGGGE